MRSRPLKRRSSITQDGKGEQYLDIVEEEVNSANQIISDLMEMPLGKAPNKQSVEIPQLAQDAYQRAKPAFTVEQRLSFSPEPFVLRADIGQLRQVLSNLLTNEIQAVQGQGTITVTGRFEKDVDSLVIQDSAYGIPPEARALVFEPLFTSKAKGTGLGSTICKQIIEHHGGTITLVENGKNGASRHGVPPLPATPTDTNVSSIQRE